LIARRARIQSVVTEKFAGGAIAYRARVTCDGVDDILSLTSAEYALAERALDAGTPLVLSIAAEESSS
jgi:hypothetical protein